MENLGRYLAVVITIVLLFLIPVSYYKHKIQRLRLCYIENLCEEYEQQIITSGEMFLTEWNEFCTSISRCGRYDIELAVGTRVDGVIENGRNANRIYVLMYMQEIMEELHQRGTFQLEDGEYFILRVREIREDKYWKKAEGL